MQIESLLFALQKGETTHILHTSKQALLLPPSLGKRIGGKLLYVPGTKFPPAVDDVWEPWPSLSRTDKKSPAAVTLPVPPAAAAYPFMKNFPPISFLQ